MGPGAAPVSGGGGLGFARSTPSGIALGAAGFLVGLSVAAGTALDPVQLSAGGEVGTVVAASQMPGDLEVNDHVSVSFLWGAPIGKPTTGAKSYYDLPVQARKYVEFIEKFTGVKVKWIGVGPGREHMIAR